MTALWTADEAAIAVNGKSTGPWQADGVSIDSREIADGDLFVAIKGPNFDGHAFVAEALGRGAAAVVVDHPIAELGDAPLLIVGDTMRALEDLAAAARQRSQAKIVAVTGSVGKTGTKEFLRAALARLGLVAATAGNLNNQWGLPLSLARMPRDVDFGVFEIGMNHPGEITPLVCLTRPDAAVITRVAEVHGAYFDNLEAIADAKAEIFLGLTTGGVAVINRDEASYDRLFAAAESAGIGRVVSFGESPDADCKLLDWTNDGAGSDVVAEIFGTTISYRLSIPGRHLVDNSLAVLAVVKALGEDVVGAAAGLADVSALKGRGLRSKVALDEGSFTVIDESYNASPVSMQAALAVLGANTPSHGGRRIAVLGDMLELGARSETLHADLTESIADNDIDLVFSAGQYMSALAEALPAARRGGHAISSERLAPLVTAAVSAGDVVMVKGSLGSATGRIVEALHAINRSAVTPGRVVNGN